MNSLSWFWCIQTIVIWGYHCFGLPPYVTQGALFLASALREWNGWMPRGLNITLAHHTGSAVEFCEYWILHILLWSTFIHSWTCHAFCCPWILGHEICAKSNSRYVSCPPHMLHDFTWELKICYMLPCNLQTVVFGWFCMGWMTSFEWQWQPILSLAEAQENEDMPTWKARFQARKVDWNFSSKRVKKLKSPNNNAFQRHMKASGWFEITVILALPTANCQVRNL